VNKLECAECFWNVVIKVPLLVLQVKLHQPVLQFWFNPKAELVNFLGCIYQSQINILIARIIFSEHINKFIIPFNSCI